MKKQKTIRTFIAFPLPESVLTKISMIQERLKQYNWKVRWVPLSNIHLTLSFLGDIDILQKQRIENTLSPLLASQMPFQLRTGNLGVFPNPRRPNVIWLGMLGDTQKLIQFQKKVQLSLEPLGFPVDKRPFKPHLTIGRVKSFIPENQLAEMLCMDFSDQPCDFSYNRLVFYQSILSSRGAKYYSLAEWNF
jgi:2'-5' RNA ligase